MFYRCLAAKKIAIPGTLRLSRNIGPALTLLMTRRHRQAEQGFFLHQRRHIEAGIRADEIGVLALVFKIPGRRSKNQNPLRGHFRLEIAETTLTRMPQATPQTHPDRGLAAEAQWNNFVGQTTVGFCDRFTQQRQMGHGNLPRQRFVPAAKFHINDTGPSGHKPRIILMFPLGVKDTPRARSVVSRLILASSSPYRRALLERLGLPFAVDVPGLDESALPGEEPSATAARLACAKARAVARRHPGATVIGSDQVADLDGLPLGKPGSRERAVQQLLQSSGRELVFHTAVCVIDEDGRESVTHCPTRVRYRVLDRATIERYVDAEQPFDCAGSARCEAMGITLLEYIRGDDPTALVGLPLIALTGLLARAGIHVP